MKTHVIITDCKESQRFPGKNGLLKEHVAEWLMEEYVPDNMHVWYVLREDENFTQQVDFDNWHVLFCPDAKEMDDHKKLIKWIWQEIAEDDDKGILLQLTQPVRKQGLLMETEELIELDNVVVSYTEWTNEHWRMVDNGTLEFVGERDEEVSHKFFDGAVFGWQGNPEKIFDIVNQKKTWVENYIGPVCDIDRPWQYSADYIRGLGELVKQNEEIYD